MKLTRKSPFVPRKVLLVVLDGVGYSPKSAEYGNAVAGAKLPVLNSLWSGHPTVRLEAHGKAVGMPSDDDMGNSEVGHNVLGCGRVFDQGAKLVNQSIEDGSLWQGVAWKEIAQNCLQHGSTLHLIGLFSDGNVHSHITHFKALLEHAKKEGVSKVRIHALLDGRDVPETSALEYIDPFEEYLGGLRTPSFDARIASGGGRMTITMDRYEADWGMIERGWKIHVLGEGRTFRSAREAIGTLRKEQPGVIDQYLPGFVIADQNGPVGRIVDGDSVVFVNFRGDRAIEISMAFTYDNLDKFPRGKRPNVVYAGMMQYDGDLKLPSRYLVSPPAIDRTIGEYMASSGVLQYAISETQKYGHVTYFWNGNRSGYFNREREQYVEVLSDIIPFDQAPKMKAAQITDELVGAVTENKFDFYRVNYANGDMVGHTGKYDATVEAMETLDASVARLKDACDRSGTVLLVTADHGNADEMYQLDKNGNVQRDKTGKPVPKTSHTLNPVNFMLYDPRGELKLNLAAEKPGLANVAATILDVMGFETPADYYPSLIQH